MDKYEQISVVGEGSYGLVMKCRHRETDQIVAIKKFLETEDDATIRKMALREIRMLKKLKHENLVTMIEVFRYRKRFYLVFEYLEGTVLDELEKMPGGLGDDRSRERIFQVSRAISYCHSNNIIHRDVKPENVLVSSLGVVKLCDFGFARLINLGEACTEYVATRWYRAPELLVGDSVYGPPIDIWAIGCLFAEMMTGDPIFPGESDIDQLYLIVKMLGKPCSRHQHLMSKSTQLRGMVKSPNETSGLYKNFPSWSLHAIDFISGCMKMDPQQRLTADELLKHSYFTHDRFPQKFLPALREKVNIEFNNPLLRKFKTEVLMSTDKKDEIRMRRLNVDQQQQQQQQRWKLTLTEGNSMKRKLSSDGNSSENVEKNLITLSNTSQRLGQNIGPKNNQFIKQLSVPNTMPKGGSNKSNRSQFNGSHNAEIHLLEKSLESLARFSTNKNTGEKDESHLEKNAANENHILPPSPNFSYQSIHFGYGDYNKSPQLNPYTTLSHHNILHPSINNISFKEPLKKSPISLGQNFHPNFIKSKSNHYPKKFDRSVPVTESTFNDTLNNSTPSWLTNLANNSFKKKEPRRMDDFSLPNLPGVVPASPKNSRKKNLPDLDLNLSTSNNVTPAFRYQRAKRKLNTLDISLPFPVKEKG